MNTIGEVMSKVNKSDLSAAQESARPVRIGEYIIKCADIVYCAAKNGEINGFAVGIVAARAKEDGTARKFALTPLADWAKQSGYLALSRSWDKYLRVVKTEHAAAEMVKAWVGSMPNAGITIGARATAALSTPEDDPSTEKADKKTDEERTEDFIRKLLTRKNNPLSATAAAEMVLSALEDCVSKTEPRVAKYISIAMDAMADAISADNEKEQAKAKASRVAKAKAKAKEAEAALEAAQAE